MGSTVLVKWDVGLSYDEKFRLSGMAGFFLISCQKIERLAINAPWPDRKEGTGGASQPLPSSDQPQYDKEALRKVGTCNARLAQYRRASLLIFIGRALHSGFLVGCFNMQI
jgi:hypothetical protein